MSKYLVCQSAKLKKCCCSFLDLEPAEQLFDNKSVTRIVCTDFPQYFALISRARQQSKTLGPSGGILSSTVVPQVQVVFPEGAINKPIRVGLQVCHRLASIADEIY
jgi:hypothetical protein